MSEPSDVPCGAHVNVGIDLEDVGRFADPDGRGLAALFTDEELAHAAASAGVGHAARLTGTWCAKEAVVKALWPWARLDPRRVSVVRDDDGRPSAEVSSPEVRAVGLQVRLSISHTSTFASAVAVAWGPSPAASARRAEKELPA